MMSNYISNSHEMLKIVGTPTTIKSDRKLFRNAFKEALVDFNPDLKDASIYPIDDSMVCLASPYWY